MTCASFPTRATGSKVKQLGATQLAQLAFSSSDPEDFTELGAYLSS